MTPAPRTPHPTPGRDSAAPASPADPVTRTLPARSAPTTHPVPTGASTADGLPADASTAFGPRLIAPLMLGSVLNPINSTMIATTLVAIGASFHVGAADTAWLVSSLYLASAVAQPAMGRLADRLGPRRVFLTGLLVVAAAGLVGMAAPSLAWLIVSRVMLGIGTSAAYPAAMALLRAHSLRIGVPTPRPVLGLLSLAGLSSAAVGPVLGGVLAATLGWRAVFAVNLPLALVGFVLALLWLPRTPAPAKDRAAGTAGASASTGGIDPVGIALFAALLTALMLFLMRLDAPPWPLLPVAAVLGGVLTWWELRRRAPFLDLRMLARNRPLSLTYLRHGMTYLVVYCVMYGYAQWLEEAHGYSSAAAGLLLLPMSVAAMITSLLGARTKGIRAPLTVAAILLVAGSGVLLLSGHTTPAVALGAAGALFGLPQGLTSTGNQAAVYAQAPPGETGSAAGLQRTSQYLGAITAASLIGLFYGQRATDAGLHEMALTSAVLGVAVLALTVADRSLRRTGGAGE
ncbi:Predicted arabinose efflux permease, MFS family [Actinacidiphila yanglinensis]|uniref:Predicted arabinose efflux permease, MFS family n=1 Tax=Actinacidiphila yanglinensis TaxID=310779 RepID=A0A1H5XN85_9ACTN|nr:MFS transporter [Actinacidiphila yanglinensis]SEG13208.1 Predicted arabinose efflux permease, MFS family [Actinacidiphila yanglinensis]